MRDVSPFAVSRRDIPPEGLSRHLVLSGGWAERILTEVDAEATTGGLGADVLLVRADQDIHADGKLVGEVTMRCGRCLAPARIVIASSFHMTFVPSGDEKVAPEEVEVSDDMVDVKEYDGVVVDLEDTLREELLLTLPFAPVCRDDCKGLCPRCGSDLNEGPCPCPPPTDERWTGLKGVKL
jgi:uncharacterized protein